MISRHKKFLWQGTRITEKNTDWFLTLLKYEFKILPGEASRSTKPPIYFWHLKYGFNKILPEEGSLDN